eukprot:gene4055-5077_t
MSFFDEDIKKSVWEGKIPVIFSLSPNDLTSHMPPASFTLMAPRNSYFPLITGTVKDHFSSSTLLFQLDEMWLEYNGIPIKWHYPIGVLYDTLVGSDPHNITSQQWNLVVHFQSYPEKTILKCQNEDSVKTYYKNVLKEANFIKHGDITKLNNLNINQSNELWDGLKNHDYDKFWSINKIFFPNSSSGYKNIPFRIIYNNKPPIQELIPPLDSSGAEITLENLFSRISFSSISNLLSPSSSSSSSSTTTSPSLQLSSPTSSFNNNSNNQESSTSTTTTTSTANTESSLLQHILSSSVKYKIQGIEPPLESSLAWLSEYFSHPDNFLYIVLFDSNITS